MSLNAMCRALFLTSIFPAIIARGRRYCSVGRISEPLPPPPPPAAPIPDSTVDGIAAFDAQTAETGGEAPEEVAAIPPSSDVSHGGRFDLTYVRWYTRLCAKSYVVSQPF